MVHRVHLRQALRPPLRRHDSADFFSERTARWLADGRDAWSVHDPAAPPSITAVQWLAAKEVLGGEASDFTPWLVKPESMQILGTALKLEELTAVTAELNVLGKRLDILASALDENGDEIPVCIENQYGMSDASHLGRLIAYLAHQQRGRAVWIVEQAHEAYVAAVRFLNRTSTEQVGYYLVEVRFTHGAAGSFQVHFEVLAAPIAWERTPKSGGGGMKPLNEPKVAYLEAIHEAVKPTLLGAGIPSMNTHARGSYLWISWPSTLWFRRFAPRFDIRVTRTTTMVVVYVWTFPTREANSIAMNVLEDRYSEALAEGVPDGSSITWSSAGSGQREAVRIERTGGYDGGDPQSAAEWASTVVLVWLQLLASDPINDLEARVQAALPGQEVSPSSEEDDVDD